MRKIISRSILLCTLFLVFFWTNSALAHVEEGDMPDSVAEMEYRILLEFEPDNLEVRFKLGMILFRSEKYSEAGDEFSNILKKAPSHVDAYIGLARVKARQQNFSKAISLFQSSLSINPADMHIYYYFGQVLEEQENFSGAEKIYNIGLAYKTPPEDKHGLEERQLLVNALEDLKKKTEVRTKKNNEDS